MVDWRKNGKEPNSARRSQRRWRGSGYDGSGMFFAGICDDPAAGPNPREYRRRNGRRESWNSAV